MAATLKLILIALGFASVFLLVGLLLRSKIKVLQKLFLPASVIGGIVGLILVQVFSRVGAVAEQVTNYVSVMDALPAILIVPIFASTPLANFKRKDNIGAAAGKATAGIANGVFWLMCGIFTVQMVIGFGVNFFMTKAGSAIPFYKVWGFELAAGFTGGHGTAASIGAIYSGIPAVAEFASQGKDVATTFATFGLIGGMILGIIFINIAARRGKTAVMKKPTALEGVALTGLQNDVSKQDSLGRETTKSFTIETLSVHLAVILGVVLASYGVSALLARVPAIGSLLKQRTQALRDGLLALLSLQAAILDHLYKTLSDALHYSRSGFVAALYPEIFVARQSARGGEYSNHSAAGHPDRRLYCRLHPDKGDRKMAP